MVLSSGSVRRASPEEYSLAEDTIGKRVKTPGWVFGKQNKGLEFYGTVTGVDKERERDGFWVLCVDVLFDDKQVCWFPIATVVQWVCDDAEGYASDTSEALADVPDLAELAEIAEAAKENGDDAIARLRFVPPKETDEERKVRLATEKWHQETTAGIGESFVENRRSSPTPPTEKSRLRDRVPFDDCPDDYTPGLATHLRENKPDSVEEGMWYVFQHLLPVREYWTELSRTSTRYAEKNGLAWIRTLRSLRVIDTSHMKGKGSNALGIVIGFRFVASSFFTRQSSSWFSRSARTTRRTFLPTNSSLV
ncbi:hypothetical protein CYMTET_25765 [Cymbomonas tetramitiformis]|uniref:Uncharacterized protein n=1 Tax=Cymbomonas tetramitiformis TaxID=36881 RepID=A0AAE0KYX0_9CHLO|nr:hypothetical protein CYMTET_25765 [Cymbomonas tetramitiformis]